MVSQVYYCRQWSYARAEVVPNAEFICALRNAAPALLDAATREAQVRALRDDIDTLATETAPDLGNYRRLAEKLLAILDAAEPQE